MKSIKKFEDKKVVCLTTTVGGYIPTGVCGDRDRTYKDGHTTTHTGDLNPFDNDHLGRG